MTNTTQTEPFQVRNCWTGDVQFNAQIAVGIPTLGLQIAAAVKWAHKSDADLRDAVLCGAVLCGAVLSGADLSGADLRDADLRDADLRDADLSDAVLRGAVLSGAVLCRAVLSGADLRDAVLCGAVLCRADLSRAVLSGADLCGAVLSRAVLSGADLSGADLRDADLRDADLRDAVLSGADLRDADLSDADLRPIRADLYDVLVGARGEAPAFLAALRAGRVDGTVYRGDCACLVGTIANARGVDVKTLPQDLSRPIERFILAIKRGDTPETNPVAKLVAEWTAAFIGEGA